jgi:hypothetical protein
MREAKLVRLGVIALCDTAHIVIIGLQDTIDREAALKKARAVTLLAAAIVRLVPAIGVTWVDGANLVRASADLSRRSTRPPWANC